MCTKLILITIILLLQKHNTTNKISNMNLINEKLKIIRNQKAHLTKKKNETIKEIENHYQRDIKILNKEETELLNQLGDIPIESEEQGG